MAEPAKSALLLSTEDRRRVPPEAATVDFAAEGVGAERLRSLWRHHARFVALRRDGTWDVGAERLSLLKMRIRGVAAVTAVYEMARLGQPQGEGLGLRLTRIEHFGRLLDMASSASDLIENTEVRKKAGRSWTKSEEDWVMDRSVPDQQLARRFNRTLGAIQVRRTQIKRRATARRFSLRGASP